MNVGAPYPYYVKESPELAVAEFLEVNYFITRWIGSILCLSMLETSWDSHMFSTETTLCFTWTVCLLVRNAMGCMIYSVAI